MTPENPDRIEVLPVLPSVDIGETLSFYRGELGFETIVYQDGGYLILRRDEMELHFWLTDDRLLCERTSVYLRGGGIGWLHAEFKARGIEKLSDMTVRPWNMEEFYIHDPHGKSVALRPDSAAGVRRSMRRGCGRRRRR